MKPITLSAALLLTAFSGFAFADAKDDVKAAAKKLAEAENYSWTSTTDNGANSQNRGPGGPTEGKTSKSGVIFITSKRGDNTNETYIKDGKVVTKSEGAWKTPEEVAAARESGGGQGGGRGRGFAGMFRNVKSPAAQAEDLAGKVDKLEEKDGALTGALSAEAVKSMLTFGGPRRDGTAAPEPKDASGTIKFWVKDGSLAKIETHVKGSVPGRDGGDMDIDRKTTTEISAVGSTKLEVPEAVTKKLAAPETK